LGDDLSALETLAGLDACAASAGVAMMLLSNNVPMNSVVRFINPPHSSLNFGRIDRESLSPPRAGREGGFNNPENKQICVNDVARGHHGQARSLRQAMSGVLPPYKVSRARWRSDSNGKAASASRPRSGDGEHFREKSLSAGY
jgi:hypothetical protein